MGNIWVILLSGVSAAGVSVIGNIVLHRLTRHDQQEDKQDTAKAEADAKLQAIARGVMFLELDKIKFLGLKYISEGVVDYDDRRLLHKMHHNYHTELGGNGDLDAIMAEVDKLPLKDGHEEQ